MNTILLSTALVISSLATGTPPPQSPPQSSPLAKPSTTKLVCVETEVLGSRLGAKRICRTAAEWARDRNEARDDTERAQRLAKQPGQD